MSLFLLWYGCHLHEVKDKETLSKLSRFFFFFLIMQHYLKQNKYTASEHYF